MDKRLWMQKGHKIFKYIQFIQNNYSVKLGC